MNVPRISYDCIFRHLHRYPASLLVGMVLLAFLSACQVVDEGPRAGSCGVSWDDPLIEVKEAKDSVSGDPLPELMVTEMSRDGSEVVLPYLFTATGAEAVNDDSLRCTIPCGFGNQEGQYTLTVAAEGYQQKTVDLGQVEYDEREERGPCPSITFRGSTEFEFELAPE